MPGKSLELKIFLLSDISPNYTRNLTCYARQRWFWEKQLGNMMSYLARSTRSCSLGGKIQTLSLTMKTVRTIRNSEPKFFLPANFGREILCDLGFTWRQRFSRSDSFRCDTNEGKPATRSELRILVHATAQQCQLECVMGEISWQFFAAHFP